MQEFCDLQGILRQLDKAFPSLTLAGICQPLKSGGFVPPRAIPPRSGFHLSPPRRRSGSCLYRFGSALRSSHTCLVGRASVPASAAPRSAGRRGCPELVKRVAGTPTPHPGSCTLMWGCGAAVASPPLGFVVRLGHREIILCPSCAPASVPF